MRNLTSKKLAVFPVLAEIFVEMSKAEDVGIEAPEGKPWVLVCPRHQGQAFFASRSEAREMHTHPDRWCADCIKNEESRQWHLRPRTYHPQSDYCHNYGRYSGFEYYSIDPVTKRHPSLGAEPR